MSQRLILFLILITTFAVYVLSPTVTNTDSAYTFHIAASILQDGDIRLDEYRQLMDLENDYRLMVVNGHVYSYYPTATPLIALPVTWVVNELFPLRYPTDFYTYLADHKPDQRTGKLELLIASFICGLCAMVIYLIAKQYLSTKAALILTLIFAFASPMYSTSSRALWQHGPSVLALSLTLYLLILFNSKAQADSRLIYLAAVFLALSYLIRPTNSLSVVFLSLYVFLNQRKYFLAFMGIMAGILVLFMIHSRITYGSVLPPYSFQLFSRFGSFSSFLNALAGLLLSPNRGLLIFSPIFFFSFYGVYLQISTGKFGLSSPGPYLGAVFIFHWLITSTFDQWDGGWTLGPRYMADLTPYLTFFLIPVMQLFSQLEEVSLIKVLFGLSVVVSIAVQAYVSISPYPYYWTGKPEALTQVPSRVWDWTDLQFLRGTCKDDPMEGKAPACWFYSSR